MGFTTIFGHISDTRKNIGEKNKLLLLLFLLLSLLSLSLLLLLLL